jgi:hypothetical protein
MWELISIICQLVFGWLLADLLSGCFHWWQDRILKEDTRLGRLGRWLVEISRLHHIKPLAFLEGSFWYRNAPTYTLAAAVSLVLWFLTGASAWLLALTIGIGVSTQVHFWAHQPSKSPAIVRKLQAYGVIQSSKIHSYHHRPPHQDHYCVLTDWVNPTLDKLQVWRRLERLLGKIA